MNCYWPSQAKSSRALRTIAALPWLPAIARPPACCPCLLPLCLRRPAPTFPQVLLHGGHAAVLPQQLAAAVELQRGQHLDAQLVAQRLPLLVISLRACTARHGRVGLSTLGTATARSSCSSRLGVARHCSTTCDGQALPRAAQHTAQRCVARRGWRAHVELQEDDVGAVARGAQEDVLQLAARLQRRLLVRLPVQLRLRQGWAAVRRAGRGSQRQGSVSPC